MATPQIRLADVSTLDLVRHIPLNGVSGVEDGPLVLELIRRLTQGRTHPYDPNVVQEALELIGTLAGWQWNDGYDHDKYYMYAQMYGIALKLKMDLPIPEYIQPAPVTVDPTKNAGRLPEDPPDDMDEDGREPLPEDWEDMDDVSVQNMRNGGVLDSFINEGQVRVVTGRDRIFYQRRKG